MNMWLGLRKFGGGPSGKALSHCLNPGQGLSVKKTRTDDDEFQAVTICAHASKQRKQNNVSHRSLTTAGK